MRYLTSLFILVSFHGLCQVSSIMYPDLYSAYQINLALINPSYIPSEVRGDFNAGYRFQTGPFKQISTLVFSGAKVKHNENGSAHVYRVLLSDEKQGPYITTPRGYANYGYQLPLSERVNVSAGAAFGVVEKYYSGTTASGNINTFLPDGSAGLTLKSEKLELGVSGQQLLNSKTKSLASDIVFQRFYQFHGAFDLPLGENARWKSNALYRLLPQAQDDWIIGTSVYIGDLVGLGVMTRSNYQLSFYTELIMDSEDDRLRVFINYNSNFISPYSYTRNSLEFGVGYALH
jgi:hypothetical protein